MRNSIKKILTAPFPTVIKKKNRFSLPSHGTLYPLIFLLRISLFPGIFSLPLSPETRPYTTSTRSGYYLTSGFEKIPFPPAEVRKTLFNFERYPSWMFRKLKGFSPVSARLRVVFGQAFYLKDQKEFKISYHVRIPELNYKSKAFFVRGKISLSPAASGSGEKITLRLLRKGPLIQEAKAEIWLTGNKDHSFVSYYAWVKLSPGGRFLLPPDRYGRYTRIYLGQAVKNFLRELKDRSLKREEEKRKTPVKK